MITAIDKVNLELKEASFVSILGSSGSGKTTLLNLLGLIDNSTSGKIYFNSRDTSLLTARERRKIRLQNIGFVFQTFNLLPTLTTRENVELPLALAQVPHDSQKKRAAHLLEAVGLSHRLEHRPAQLSAGEMQRVAIARALVNDPNLILADEPTGNLDTATGSEIIDLLLNLSRSHRTTVLVATHDERIAKVADEVYCLQDGAVSRKQT
jgi:putative ABC transport system ATP-binding protein